MGMTQRARERRVKRLHHELVFAEEKAVRLRKYANEQAARPDAREICQMTWDGWPMPGGCPICGAESRAVDAREEVYALQKKYDKAIAEAALIK